MRTPTVVLVLLSGSPALAADVALNLSALEVVTVPPPAHGGFYPSVGVSLAFPLGPVTIIPSLALEWSFDQGRGGLVLSATADFPVSERLGIDLNVFLVHDQPGLRVSESVFYVGAGPGLSIFLGKWTISPSLGVYAGLTTPGLSFGPAINLAWTIS